MTDAAATTGASAQTQTGGTGASEATTQAPSTIASQTTETQATANQGFQVPDAYKEKPWAAKVKSNDDVWKALDGAQELIGKKTLPPIDFAKATPEELIKFNETMRPADVKAYNLEAVGLPADHAIGKILQESGIPAHQGHAAIKAYQAYEAAQMAEATSAEGFKSAMKAKFGDGYEPVVASAEKMLKQHLSDEDKQLFDKLPNSVLPSVYALVANMQKAYGAHETGAQVSGNNDAGGIKVDVETQRADLRNQIQTLSNGVHTAEQKQALIDKLAATYKG